MSPPAVQEPMIDPVLCADGHTYERRAVEAWCGSTRYEKVMFPCAATRPNIMATHSEGLLDLHAHPL